MIEKWFCVAIIMTGGSLAHASDQIAGFQKSCLSAKKRASLCQCLVANLNRRFEAKELSEDMIPVAHQALKGEAPQGDANTTYYDNLADFLAGLEPHCLKNPKYNSSEP